jgi:hypothetical protein
MSKSMDKVEIVVSHICAALDPTLCRARDVDKVWTWIPGHLACRAALACPPTRRRLPCGRPPLCWR